MVNDRNKIRGYYIIMARTFKILRVDEESGTVIVCWKDGLLEKELSHNLPIDETGSPLTGANLVEWGTHNFPETIFETKKRFEGGTLKFKTTSTTITMKKITPLEDIFSRKSGDVHKGYNRICSKTFDTKKGVELWSIASKEGGSIQNEANAISLGILPANGFIPLCTTDYMVAEYTVEEFLDFYERFSEFRRGLRRIEGGIVREMLDIMNGPATETEKRSLIENFDIEKNWPTDNKV
jgi:hypothetical protein